MAYNVDLRSRVIGYIKEGNSQEQASVIFKIGTVNDNEVVDVTFRNRKLGEKTVKSGELLGLT